ncbi:MAG: hypothetical protein J2P59_07525 [Acidimicrobiales bacterium]|nr:hypothetical protein [Acidimicrobiales bacterium]
MSSSVTNLSPGGDVQAVTTYVVKDGVERPYGKAPADDRSIVFHDMRRVEDQPTLAREGFALVTCPTSVTDFTDHDQVINRYLPEIRELVRRLFGTPKVYMQQNWVFRGDDRETGTEVVNEWNRVSTMQTHGVLHSDYYEQETAGRLATRSMAAYGVTERPPGRLLGINTWRAISPPPQDRPLALLDRRTLDPSDYVDALIGTRERGLLSIQSRFNPRHRFCWWSNMAPDELLVFLQYEEGRGPTSTVMHTSFTDPNCPPGAPLRQSIEARAYAFIED